MDKEFETICSVKASYDKVGNIKYWNFNIPRGRRFKTKYFDGQEFIIGFFGNKICRVNSAFQQSYFRRL